AHNPNRTRQPFDVTLRSQERVQQVDAPAAYDVDGSRYRFQLPPGDATLTLTGTLGGAAFTPPVDASVQYVLVESDPLIRPVVTGATHRISPSEVGIAADYRGAQAYLLGKGERLAWTATRLEALRSPTFAV